MEPQWEENHRNGWKKLLGEHFKNFVEKKAAQ
ncbi:hypothetical protein J2S10_003994 [Neobacillus ginsengisoli]|uniref:Uncharacterized protein n=1 Tax=Neobacillus ginsengisoli TaxID=904295 RepID=A0ABT9XYZ0_9BACI|nr:hypothetical protein [Neobacillus ginsengisoli]